MIDTPDQDTPTPRSGEPDLLAMVRKTRRLCMTASIVAVLLPAAVLASVWAWNVHTRHRVEWWLEHSYPVGVQMLTPDANRYFPSYEKWSEAGRKIPGIEKVLIDKYAVADLWEKRHLLYAMGAVPSPRTFSFLIDVALSTNDPKLREAALGWGLGPNIAEPVVQQTYLDVATNSEQPIEIRLGPLRALVEAGNAEAMVYLKEHAQEQLALTQTLGLAGHREWLLTTLNLPYPTSQPSSLPSSGPRHLSPASQPEPTPPSPPTTQLNPAVSPGSPAPTP